jgi:hypothetical protein
MRPLLRHRGASEDGRGVWGSFEISIAEVARSLRRAWPRLAWEKGLDNRNFGLRENLFLGDFLGRNSIRF